MEGKSKVNKLRIQIENVAVIIIKYNERNKIYNNCFLQKIVFEKNNCDKNNIVYSIECLFINVNFVFFLLLFLLLLGFSFYLFVCYRYFFLSLGIWDPKLTNAKPGDRPQF